MARTLGELLAMPHEQLARLALNQAEEINLVLGHKANLARALTARRAEVADLRRRLGLAPDSVCRAAEREQLLDGNSR